MNKKMKKASIKNGGKENKYRLSIASYSYGGGLSIGVYENEEGSDERWGDLTVNLSGVCGLNAAFIDTNNCRGVIESLIEHQMGTLTGRVEKSGFCEYPEFLFDEEKLRQADEEGYQKYLEQCDQEHVGMSKVYGTCRICNNTKVFYVSMEQKEKYDAYLDGEGLIQDVFPDMPGPDRELLKSGTCGKCWKKMLGIPD